ncbi:hypothetical protein FF098_002460 [Parvularcula flava]|uniref:Uncharacterized protein n=1 Tax=Aquisalinus luteolus TaxID=1566827 RepID=A0A8J3A5H7_9PROT|nr:hypothetical protein [Aquisalinus luteolus]NHK26770.1 hypothetical protein [Aquisalinus luteolus]GGH93358.1 hypothetical protein GCM10011355_05010 [Aquisalinus luteolus]
MRQAPVHIAQFLLKTILPTEDAEAILGDIEEIAESKSDAKNPLHRDAVYVYEVLRSMPALALRNAELALGRIDTGHVLLLALSIAFVILWERGIAHVYAWPLSQATGDLLGLGALHACRWSYIFLSVSGLIAWLVTLRASAAYWPVLWKWLGTAPLLSVLCGCALAVYFMIRPDPTDGLLHRCFHILTTVIAGVAMYSVCRFNPERHVRPSDGPAANT